MNADRLDDWRNRTMRLQYQLNKAHEQAELKKKAERAREEAEKRRQEKQQKEQDATALARTRQAEVKAYQSRFDNML
ncbi:hypothetical protein R0J89_20025, partial [Psychrobacter sp. SIMBA_152]